MDAELKHAEAQKEAEEQQRKEVDKLQAHVAEALEDVVQVRQQHQRDTDRLTKEKVTAERELRDQIRRLREEAEAAARAEAARAAEELARQREVGVSLSRAPSATRSDPG
jgi:septal ring factor EnvC (AmiA/AmiB activator)